MDSNANIDHLIYTVPDLAAGRDEVEARLGVRPAVGGRHPVWGTHNALLSLGPACYLEVMAADPDLPTPEGGRLFDLDRLEEPRLCTWVLRCEEGLDAMADRARAAGVALGPVFAGSRETPDGGVLSWRLSDPRALPFDGTVPFLIAWGSTPHPGTTAPRAGSLAGFRLEHPRPDAVRSALDVLGIQVPVEEGPRAALVATIQTPGGRVELR